MSQLMGRVSHPKEARTRGLELFRDHGAADVSRLLAAEGWPGVSPSTIRGWAQRAGVRSERTETVRPMLEAHAISLEERRAVLADTLLRIAEHAAGLELGMLADAGLRDVVGARTRAIHDHQLLTGAATSRTETGGADTAHGLIDELAARRTPRAA